MIITQQMIERGFVTFEKTIEILNQTLNEDFMMVDIYNMIDSKKLDMVAFYEDNKLCVGRLPLEFNYPENIVDRCGIKMEIQGDCGTSAVLFTEYNKGLFRLELKDGCQLENWAKKCVVEPITVSDCVIQIKDEIEYDYHPATTTPILGVSAIGIKNYIESKESTKQRITETYNQFVAQNQGKKIPHGFQKRIAIQFGVTPSYVSQVINELQQKHETNSNVFKNIIGRS